MIIGYTTRTPIIHLVDTGNLERGICEVVSLVINSPVPPASQGPTPTEVNYGTLDHAKVGNQFSATGSLLERPIEVVDGPVFLRRVSEKVLERAAVPTDGRSMVDLSAIEDSKFRDEVMTMLFIHDKLWMGRSETIKATYYSTSLFSGTKPIRQQPYWACQRSGEVVKEHIFNHLEAGIIKSAQL